MAVGLVYDFQPLGDDFAQLRRESFGVCEGEVLVWDKSFVVVTLEVEEQI